MGKTDLSLRQKAIPFQGQIFNYNANEQSSQRASQAWDLGDLYFLNISEASNALRYWTVKLLKPFYGSISQAYFTFDLQTAGSSPVSMYLGAAPFVNDYRPDNILDTPSVEGIIKGQHDQIFGDSAPITVAGGSRIQIEAADIMPLISQDPASDFYSPFFFNLAFLFEQAPSKVSLWEVIRFRVDAAVNIRL